MAADEGVEGGVGERGRRRRPAPACHRHAPRCRGVRDGRDGTASDMDHMYKPLRTGTRPEPCAEVGRSGAAVVACDGYWLERRCYELGRAEASLTLAACRSARDLSYDGLASSISSYSVSSSRPFIA